MRATFILMAVLGVTYLALLFFFSADPALVNRYRNRLSKERLLGKFRNTHLDDLLTDLGWSINSQFYNYMRFGAAGLYILVSVLSNLAAGAKISFISTVLVPVLWLVLTHPGPGMPVTWALQRMIGSRASKRNSELLTFIQTYRIDRSRLGRKTQFWNFCFEMAPSLPMLEKDLMRLGTRVTEDGLENALRWFTSLFPDDHPFAGELMSIVLSAERAQNRESVARALEKQGELLAKVSSSRYAETWKSVGELSSALNALPSIVTLITMIMLIFNYVGIISRNIFY